MYDNTTPRKHMSFSELLQASGYSSSLQKASDKFNYEGSPLHHDFPYPNAGNCHSFLKNKTLQM